MILTCPDCATSYFVPDGSVPAQGRTVKCSSCGARWRAVAEPDPPPEDDLAFEAAAPAEPVAAVEPESTPEVDPADDLEVVMAQFRKPDAGAKPKKRRGALFAGIGIAATLALAAGAVFTLRDPIVRMAPAAGPLYAQAGMPAGEMGLMIEAVKSKAVFQGGRPVLSVSGEIVNTAGRTVSAPPLRINVLDKEGKPLAAKLAHPLNASIPAGAKRYFTVAVADPPAGLADLEVVFDEGAAKGHAAPAHGKPAAPAHAAEAAAHDGHG